VNQSKLQENAYSRDKAREKRVQVSQIGFGFTSDQMSQCMALGLAWKYKTKTNGNSFDSRRIKSALTTITSIFRIHYSSE